MKRMIILMYCINIGTFLEGKAVLVSPSRRSITHQKSNLYTEIQHILTSDKECTVLLEAHTTEEALEMLPYLPILQQYNKTIICKAPEDILSLLTWCPFINQVVYTQSIPSYTIKLNYKDLESYIPRHILTQSKSGPLLISNDTACAIWQETFELDANFKIGIYCEPVHTSYLTTKHKITAESLFPLALLNNISIYSFDTLNQDSSPEGITIYHFDKQSKESLAHAASLIHHMDLIITTQPIIAYISEALHKTTWLIVAPEADTEVFKQIHPHIELLTESTDDRILCTIIRKLSKTTIKPTSELITAEVAIGELIDKITILEIKTEQIKDEKKLKNIYRELESLYRTCNRFITTNTQLQELFTQLKQTNLMLWITEDLIRDKERAKCFDDEFIQLARSVYIQNDERCRVKRCINELLGSRLIEEKSYKPYN